LGYLVLEHGYDQAESVRALMSEQGLTDVTTVKDLAGHERVTRGQWPGK
jgi:release factor glutamine methyltransferase